MEAEKKYFKLGLFVLGAVAIGIATVVVLGAGTLFKKTWLVETYVNESIQGLDVGAPVKFRGVRIGELEKVDLVEQVYSIKDSRIRLLMKFHLEAAPNVLKGNAQEVLNRLSKAGMRARLASAGLTGGTYIELDILDPKANPPMEIPWTSGNAYVPSVPSTGTRVTNSVEAILERVEKMRFDVISDKAITLLDSLDKVAKSLDPALGDFRTLASDTDALIKDARRVITGEVATELKGLIAQIRDMCEKDLAPAIRGIRAATEHLPGTFDKVDAALDGVTATLRKLDRSLADDNGSLDEALDNIRVVTQDLRDLTGQLKRYPSQSLFGEAPPKRAVNK